MTTTDRDLEPTGFTLTREDVDRAHAASKPTDRTRVLVADPDQLARRALTDSLRDGGAFTVVAQASDGVEAVELARHYRPDVVLIAASLTGLDVAAACEQIVRGDARDPRRGARDLARPRARDARRARRRERLRDQDRRLGVDRARALSCHRRQRDHLPRADRRSWSTACAARPRTEPGRGPVSSKLTNREWEILDLICGGQGTREIADTLFLSPETVNSHVKNVLKKLGVHSRAAAVAGRIAAARRRARLSCRCARAARALRECADARLPRRAHAGCRERCTAAISRCS